MGKGKSYEEWYHSKRHKQTYLRHRKLVQLVGSTDPGRRWLLKYPVHLRQLDTLLEVYPDACIVHTHRDPRQVTPSYINMVATYRALFEDNIDRADIARTQLAGWAEAANRSAAIHQQHSASQFYDLYFEDFVADPVDSVARIYEHFNQPFSEQSQQALRAWNEGNPQHKHGKHVYSGEGTGITEQQILDAFSDYMDYFYAGR